MNQKMAGDKTWYIISLLLRMFSPTLRLFCLIMGTTCAQKISVHIECPRKALATKGEKGFIDKRI